MRPPRPPTPRPPRRPQRQRLSRRRPPTATSNPALQETQEELKAMASTQEWIDELKAISVLELSERIKALEEEFGVSATAVAAAAPAAGGG
ncbi:MAG TPA: hypothetical protein VM266_01130, partial [Solirubrobacteraceae bacterium]|nr:hypothetical protein [Solirubrobacteraceae bacterium]